MDTARRVDSVLGASKQSTAHTTRSANEDILKMAVHMRKEKATDEVSGRSAPAFIDNTDAAWKKLTTTNWIKDILSKKPAARRSPGYEQ